MGQAYVPGQVIRQGNVLRFTPDEPLDAGAVYQVYVAGATSFLGELQAGAYRWTFETPDAVAPQVVRTAPEDRATDAARDGALTAYFNQALLVGGEGVTFEVTDPAGKPVVGHLAWVPGDEDLEADIGLNTEGRYQGYRGLRFQPSMPLEGSTVYQVRVKDVQNLAGLPMEPYAWSFTTSGSMIFTTPTPVVRRYYLFNGQRVALRETGLDGQDVLYWIGGDHLGTTSLVLNEAGDTIVAESRHYPYGEERWRSPESGTFPTDLRFTGQRNHPSLGSVYHMGARFLDVALGRWLSADTIIPDPAAPQSFNRYSWVVGNPIRFRDPSGREPEFPMIDGEFTPDYWLRYYAWVRPYYDDDTMRTTSPFGAERAGYKHEGVDFASTTGEPFPVLAARTGNVAEVGSDGTIGAFLYEKRRLDAAGNPISGDENQLSEVEVWRARHYEQHGILDDEGSLATGQDPDGTTWAWIDITPKYWSDSPGIRIGIDHGGGMKSWYYHVEPAESLAVNQTVYRGEVIGMAANTGHSKGLHLHFEIRQSGEAKNPMLYIR